MAAPIPTVNCLTPIVQSKWCWIVDLMTMLWFEFVEEPFKDIGFLLLNNNSFMLAVLVIATYMRRVVQSVVIVMTVIVSAVLVRVW